jgi:leucyl aminopeptidase
VGLDEGALVISFDLVKAVPDDVELVVEPISVEEAVGVPGAAVAGFEGKPGQVFLVGDALLVGVGPAASVSADGLRRAAGTAARAAGRAERVATTLLSAAAGVDGVTPAAAAQAVAEGFALGAYSFTAYRSDPKPNRLSRVDVVGGGGTAVRNALERGARVAEAVALARDLVNEPGGLLTAPKLAAETTKIAERTGLTITVLDEKGMAKAGIAGVLAVNRGSTIKPRFVELTYEPPAKPKATVALIGKGITFDSGGLSLKTADGMTTMKDDMGGAAAVIAAMSACADLGVKVRVRAFLPLTDNMPGGDAMRVGDVIRYRNGRTVEVLNTDAEGRLVLADALCVASDERPDAIVDVATLTGAQEVALGKRVAAVFSNHEGWAEQVLAAGERAGEPLWPLPLHETYRRDLDSKVADLKNISGNRFAGAIVAALFLREFVADGIPWAHLDIAGPAFGDADDGELSAGATGFGVRTLLALLTSYKKP